MTYRALSRAPRPALRSAALLLMLAACADGRAPTDVRATAAAPQVTATSAATLVPGRTVTLTGLNFDPTREANVVRIGGVRATVTAAGPTSLDVVVPCVPSGPVVVQVESEGRAGVPLRRSVQAPRRTLAVGQSLVLSGEGEAECNELTASGGDARYLLAVYNASTDAGSSVAFQLSAPGNPAAGPGQGQGTASFAAAAPGPQGQTVEDAHLRIMEMNRREHARLRARAAGDAGNAGMRARRETAVSAGPPPLTRTIRVADVVANSCDQYYTVNATRVYYDGRIALYEDDATAGWLKAAANPAMRAHYRAIGDQYNAFIDPLVRSSFGDPLLRDASTDANGALVVLFTPLLNTQFGGVPAYVVSCDFFPNGEGNSASNNGEYVYAYQPTVNATGYTALTPDTWYWNIRSGLSHEAKHVASLSARAAVDADFDDFWLEEGTARHAEELWSRNVVYDVGWKANTGYGSEASPNSVYCDLKRFSAACLAASPTRPTMAMYRHFQGLTHFLRAPAYHSPFGPTAAAPNSSFYATAWSLVRYAIDRYGVSDAAFLTALNSSTATGVENLAARAGVPIEELLGGWALALYADDYPGLAGADAAIQMPTWNFRGIYAGLHGDYPNAFPTPFLIAPHPLTFGAVGSVDVPFVAGGGVAYFELSGQHARAQLLRLQGTDGGALPSTLRLAVARLQ
jgi:hypothetical protein